MSADDEEEGYSHLMKVYERFKASLADKRQSSYFDEQDLIDVFDYAGDVHDEYVRMEAIIEGARMFPHSDDLLKRRAVWLAGIDEGSFKAFVFDNASKAEQGDDDSMWEIFTLRTMGLTGKPAQDALEAFIDKRRFDDDETVIQFVTLVRQMQQEQWLIDNLDRVRKMCAYDQTLLFEIARLAETNTQVEQSIKLLEELTMLDPFNPDYWGLLAELQSNTGKFHDALTSLDYAKAITPGDAELLSLEGYVLIKAEQYDKAVKPLREALAISPDYFPARRNLLDAYIGSGDATNAAPLAVQLNSIDPGDPTLLCAVLIYAPEQSERAMKAFYLATAPDEPSTIQLAGDLCQDGHPQAALRLLKFYDDNYTLTQTGQFALLETMYITSNFRQAYEYLVDRIKSPVLRPNELPIIAVIVSILVRLKEYGEALSFCDTWIDRLQNPALRGNAYRLINRGLLAFLTDIRAILLDPHNDLGSLDDMLL